MNIIHLFLYKITIHASKFTVVSQYISGQLNCNKARAMTSGNVMALI